MLRNLKAFIKKYWPVVVTAVIGFITFVLTRKDKPVPVVNEQHTQIDYTQKQQDVAEHQQEVVKVQETQAQVVKNETSRPVQVDSKRDLRSIVDDFNSGV